MWLVLILVSGFLVFDLDWVCESLVEGIILILFKYLLFNVSCISIEIIILIFVMMKFYC